MSALTTLVVRHGHYVLESGLHAATWLDLDSLFEDPCALAPEISRLASRIAPHAPTAICGPLVGGAFVAQAVATTLGVRFFFTHRAADRPDATLYAATYALGEAQRQRIATERVAIVDDVISAGSSVRATERAVRDAGAQVVVIGALHVLGRHAVDHHAQVAMPLVANTFEDFAAWTPDRCPLCRDGVASTAHPG